MNKICITWIIWSHTVFPSIKTSVQHSRTRNNKRQVSSRIWTSSSKVWFLQKLKFHQKPTDQQNIKLQLQSLVPTKVEVPPIVWSKLHTLCKSLVYCDLQHKTMNQCKCTNQQYLASELVIKVVLCFPHGLWPKQLVVYIRSALISEVRQKLDDVS